MVKYWKIFCMEDKYPSLWRRWLEANCVAVGWGPGYGYRLDGTGEPWAETEADQARRNLLDVIVGDEVVVHLPGLRVARVGAVLDIRVQDREWSPLILPSSVHEHGEFGRRIGVRWNQEVGPSAHDQVVQMAENLFGGALPKSIAPLSEETFERILEVMRNPGHWIRL